MLDLLLLAIISFLVARVIWNVFGVFQSFFSYLSGNPKTKSNTHQQPKIQPSKINEVKKTANPPQNQNKQKLKKQEKSVNGSVTSKKVEKDQTLSIKLIEKKQPTKLEEVSQVKVQKKEELFPIKLQEEITESNLISKNQYQLIIQQLRDKISLYQKESQKHIQTIEQIQQHIVNSTENQNRNVSEDHQSVQIQTLREQLTATELKLYQQKNLLINSFNQEKQLLIRNYEKKIQEIQTSHQEKNILYETTINEATQKIHLLQSKEIESNNQQISRNEATSQIQLLNQRAQVQGLKKKLQEINHQKNNLNKKYKQQVRSLTQESQRLKSQLSYLREELSRSQNDVIEYQTKHGAQIESLQIHNQELTSNLQKNQQTLFIFQQQNQELKSKLHNQEFNGERNNQQLSSLQRKLQEQSNAKQDLEKKLQQTLDQLRFCQQQLNDTKQTEFDLKKKLATAMQSPKKTIKKEDIENSPEYSAIKIDLQRFKRKLADKQQIINRIRTPENQQREVSPTFALQSKVTPKRLTPSPLPEQRKMQQTSPYTRPISTKSPSQRGVSAIYASQYRSNTPAEKLTPASTIMEGGISSEVYLRQTQILNEAQRNIIVHQVSAIKKISVKKTRMMFSLKQKSNKSIHEFILGAPNIILVAELQNKKVIGAFTQNAFSKENKFTKSSIVSKAMIFDVSRQVFITNEGQGEIIRCQENTLIWGNKEFVVNCQEAINISINLNCQNSIYPSNYSTFQFLDSEENNIKVSKLQIHRVFLG